MIRHIPATPLIQGLANCMILCCLGLGGESRADSVIVNPEVVINAVRSYESFIEDASGSCTVTYRMLSGQRVGGHVFMGIGPEPVPYRIEHDFAWRADGRMLRTMKRTFSPRGEAPFFRSEVFGKPGYSVSHSWRDETEQFLLRPTKGDPFSGLGELGPWLVMNQSVIRGVTDSLAGILARYQFKVRSEEGTRGIQWAVSTTFPLFEYVPKYFHTIELELWVDPQLGCAVTRQIWTSRSPRGPEFDRKREIVAEEYVERHTGWYFPSRVMLYIGPAEGPRDGEWGLTFHEIEFNLGLPASHFDAHVPADSIVYNKQTKKAFRTAKPMAASHIWSATGDCD
jgi:hypothetical protein